MAERSTADIRRLSRIEFLEGKSFAEIAARMGVTEERLRQWHDEGNWAKDKLNAQREIEAADYARIVLRQRELLSQQAEMAKLLSGLSLETLVGVVVDVKNGGDAKMDPARKRMLSIARATGAISLLAAQIARMSFPSASEDLIAKFINDLEAMRERYFAANSPGPASRRRGRPKKKVRR